MTLGRVLWVICFSLYPHIMFASVNSINGIIFLFRRRSKTLGKADSTLIDRSIAIFKVQVPSLYTGDTSASLNELGKMQDCNNEFAMIVTLLKERSDVIIRRFHTLMSVGRKKLSVCQNNVAAFSYCGKLFFSLY